MVAAGTSVPGTGSGLQAGSSTCSRGYVRSFVAHCLSPEAFSRSGYVRSFVAHCLSPEPSCSVLAMDIEKLRRIPLFADLHDRTLERIAELSTEFEEPA